MHPSSLCRGLGILAALTGIGLVGCCDNRPTSAYPGYAEGEFVRVAAPFAGNLTALSVERGSQVRANDPLFVLEQENEQAARKESAERLQRAEALLKDLMKGKRPDELAAIGEQHRQAAASARLSQIQLRRQEQLAANGFVSKERVDEARASADRDQARLSELAAQLRVAKLAGRSDEIAAAKADVRAAQAALAQAEWKLAQKSVRAPLAGTVHERYYVPGEWVPAGSPVVSLLPPENLKLRFFVPEPELGKIRLGQTVTAQCDGCAAAVRATVSFIAAQAEYTPPVIYSRESRAKLVFLVEARPAAADAVHLHPGQPLDIAIAP